MKSILLLLAIVGVAFSQHNLTEMIVGGKAESISDSPFYIRLKISITPTTEALCGGSIVSMWNVVSAAHCLIFNVSHELKPVPNVFVIAGSDESTAATQQIQVARSIVHPKYLRSYVLNPKEEKSIHDISILSLSQTLIYSRTIASIAIGREVPPTGTFLKTIGFGKTDFSNYPPRLQSAEIPLIDRETCVLYKYYVEKSHICAGYLKFTGPSICSGDSGGPLVWNNLLVGVTSLAVLVCVSGPSVFTNVPAFADWITENIIPDPN